MSAFGLNSTIEAMIAVDVIHSFRDGGACGRDEPSGRSWDGNSGESGQTDGSMTPSFRSVGVRVTGHPGECAPAQIPAFSRPPGRHRI